MPEERRLRLSFLKINIDIHFAHLLWQILLCKLLHLSITDQWGASYPTLPLLVELFQDIHSSLPIHTPQPNPFLYYSVLSSSSVGTSLPGLALLNPLCLDWRCSILFGTPYPPFLHSSTGIDTSLSSLGLLSLNYHSILFCRHPTILAFIPWAGWLSIHNSIRWSAVSLLNFIRDFVSPPVGTDDLGWVHRHPNQCSLA